jgi:hypothetical protein
MMKVCIEHIAPEYRGEWNGAERRRRRRLRLGCKKWLLALS